MRGGGGAPHECVCFQLHPHAACVWARRGGEADLDSADLSPSRDDRSGTAGREARKTRNSPNLVKMVEFNEISRNSPKLGHFPQNRLNYLVKT